MPQNRPSAALPATDRRRYRRLARLLEAWYESECRELPWRRSHHPYQILVSEVMLQQTRVEVVAGYFERFIERFPTIGDLAAAGDDEVTRLWSGLGYYRRARLLRDAARAVVERFEGIIPDDPALLAQLPGIGRYTAGAVASIAFDRRTAIVDGNVARVIARLEAVEAPARSTALEKASWDVSSKLVAACSSPRLLNQALMELGALVCRPAAADCSRCPLARSCRAFRSGRQNELPRAGEPKKMIDLVVPLFIVADGSGRLLFRRERGPLMSELFHLPHGSGDLLADSSPAFITGRAIGEVRHVVTNRRIRFRIFRASHRGDRLCEGSSDYVWWHPEELDGLPHPSYVRKAVEVWRKAESGAAAEGRTA